MKRNYGFSLIEFIIALTIGALIVSVVISIYASNKSTFLIQEGLARLQESGRYANYFLSKEIRMAGFQGCANQRQVTINNLVKSPSLMAVYDTPVKGFDGLGSSFSPTLPANISAKSPLASSDVIEVRHASTDRIQLSSDMASPTDPISIYPKAGFSAGNAVMITNCIVGDIFVAGQASTSSSITHSATQNTTASFSTYYLKNSQLLTFNYFAFYIKNTGRLNSAGQAIPALYRLDVTGNEEEIAEGVELMHITYGIDTNKDNAADTYQTAQEVNASNNWNNIISVQINLLIATTENVSDKPFSYTFNGTTYTSTDKKLRREWLSFITLRNRGLSL